MLAVLSSLLRSGSIIEPQPQVSCQIEAWRLEQSSNCHFSGSMVLGHSNQALVSLFIALFDYINQYF